MATFDVIIVGAGMSGLATAARLQARGLSTLVLEVHNVPGGCSGYYKKNGFMFDVGATTLVNFEDGTIGDELLKCVGIKLSGDILPGYKAWLPDKVVTVHRDNFKWKQERDDKFGQCAQLQKFWKSFDSVSENFWNAVDGGIKLPIQSFSDLKNNMSALGWSNILQARFLASSLGSQIDKHKLRDNKALVGLLSMMVEDTLHSRTIDDAPFINSALGCSIRGHIIRPHGGMYGFFDKFCDGYQHIGGQILYKHKVEKITGSLGNYIVHTKRGEFKAKYVVSTISLPVIQQISPENVQKKLRKFIKRDADSYGAGILVTLGVPNNEVENDEFTHHQLMQDYDAPLGNGNNMFISVSSPNDALSAPLGFRSVMISTHTQIDEWKGLDKEAHKLKKTQIGDKLLNYARRVYPELGRRAIVYDIATPQTYERFARRPLGAVGGVRQTMRNSNQFSVPQNIGVKGFYLAGDYTWPGVGTTACVLGSKIVENAILKDLG